MSATRSFLNKAPDQPDLVVALTEASIDSALRAYLLRSFSWPRKLCYVGQDEPDNPLSSIQHGYLVGVWRGEDPFQLPDGTPYSDWRLRMYDASNFSVGFSITLGMPNGVKPRDLPQPVLQLNKGEDGYDGTYNMYCSQFVIVWNERPSPQNGNQARWHRWEQPFGEAWPVAVRVNLVHESVVDHQGMSVQQVRVDLVNASWSPFVTFGPVGWETDSLVRRILKKDFLGAYSDLVRLASFPGGEPALKLRTLVPSGRGTVGPDGNDGFMRITDFTTRVAPYPALSDPAFGHDDCRALELLCAVNGRPLPAPSATTFPWAWAEPDDVPSSGGVIAVHRLVFIDWLKAQLMPAIRMACISPTVDVAANWTSDSPPSPGPFNPLPGKEPVLWNWSLDFMGDPDNVIITLENNPRVLAVRHERMVSATCNAEHFQDFASLLVHTQFMADVDVKGTTVVVTRYHFAEIKWHWLRQAQPAGTELHVFSRTVVDTYALTVDTDGRMSLADPLSTVTDKSEPFGPEKFDVVSAPLQQLCKEIRNVSEAAAMTPVFRSEEFDRLRSFVFPGAGSFTFREARVSVGGDLICYITSTDEDLLPPWGDDATPAVGGATEGGDASSGPAGGGNGGTASGKLDNHLDDWNNDNPPPPGPPPNVSFSTELMTNYMLGTLHSPYGKFEALQTADGHSLVFSLTADGELTVLEEASGTSHAGWTLTNLSRRGIVRNFLNVRGVPRVRTFGVGQSAVDGTIGMAMAVRTGGTDHLFLSLGNSNSDTSWIQNPQWVRCHFDAVGNANTPITVAGILFAEATDVSTQSVVVDLERTAAPKPEPKPVDQTKDAGDDTKDEEDEDAALRADPDVVRYIVDLLAPAGTRLWTRHDLPIDVEAGSYQSCVGRRGSPPYNGGPAAPKYEGTYTCGVAGTSGQLVFVPLVNRFGRSPPAPAVLHLPGDRIPDAIATARNSNDSRPGWDPLYTTTDLYVVSGDTLYRFAAENQTHGSVGVPVKTAAILQGTTQLAAMWSGGVVIIWGRNIRGEVYYISCWTLPFPKGPEGWSNPLAIATGVDHISSYLNRSDGGNTIFAATDGKLQKLTKATDGGMGWTVQDVVVNVDSSMTKARPFNSYTIAIHVTEQSGAPAANRTVGLATKSRAPVYVDGRYYVLSPRPTAVTTNAMGTITVIEPTSGLTSNTFSVHIPGAVDVAVVDPSAKSFAKLSQLDSEAALRGAKVPAQSSLVAGGLNDPNPATTTLVDPSANGDDVKTAAQNMGLLKQVYGWAGDGGGTQGSTAQGLTPMGLKAAGPEAGGKRLASMRVLSSNSTAGVRDPGGLGNAETPGASLFTASSAAAGTGTGDMSDNKPQFEALSFLDISFDPADVWHTVERAIAGGFKDGFNAMVQAGEDGWHLVTKLGDTVYTLTISTVEEVVKAVVMVFEAIKSKIEDIIAFIMFLLQWNDISRTKKVLHNTARLYLKNLAEGVIPSLGSTISDGIQMAEDTVAKWAGTSSSSSDGSSGGGGTFSTMDWSALGAPAGLQASSLAGNPGSGQTSASQLLSSHFQSHVGGLTLIGSTSPDVDVKQGDIDELLKAVQKQGVVLQKAFSDLQSLANDFSNLSIEDVLRRIAGILVTGLLSGVKAVVDALVVVLSSAASSALNILDAKIHFPVISDILDALGIGSLSFLDLFCWIAAVAYTIVYKIAEGNAPFPDNGDTQKLIDAQSWAELAALKTQQPQPLVFPGNQLLAAASKSPPSDKDIALYTSGHGLSALLVFIGNFLQVLEANSPTGRNEYAGTASLVIGLVAAGANGYAGFFVPRLPIKNVAVVRLNQATAAVSVMMKVLFSDGVLSKIGEGTGKLDGGGNGTGTGTSAGGPTPGGGGATPSPAGGGGGGAAPSPQWDPRGTAAFINATCVIPSLFCTAWHFYELAALPADNDRSAAIVEEVANLTRYTARIAYATAVNSSGQTKIAAVAVMAGATASAAGLEAAQAGIQL